MNPTAGRIVAATQLCASTGVVPPWRHDTPERLALFEAISAYPGDDEHPRIGNLVDDDNLLPLALLRPVGSSRNVVVTVVEITADLTMRHSYWTATPRQRSVEFTGPHLTSAAAWATGSTQHAA